MKQVKYEIDSKFEQFDEAFKKIQNVEIQQDIYKLKIEDVEYKVEINKQNLKTLNYQYDQLLKQVGKSDDLKVQEQRIQIKFQDMHK